MSVRLRSFLKSNRYLGAITGLGLGSSTVIGACGGLCGASLFPLGAFLVSMGLGSVAIFLVKLRIPLLIFAALFGAIWIKNLIARRNKLPAVIVGITLGFALVYSGLQIFFPLGVFGNSQKALVVETNIQEFKLEFNKAVDKVRVISLMSPGCDVCQRAFKQTVSKTFSQIHSDNLKGMNIWLPWVWGDSRDLAGVVASTQTDSRVLNYWDENAEFSKAITKSLGAKLDLWDVYLIYGPGVQWIDDAPPKPNFFMHQLPEKYGLDMNLHLDSEKFMEEAKTLITENDELVSRREQ